MKKSLKLLLEKFVQIFYFLFNVFFSLLKRFGNLLYSYWIKNKFKFCGLNFSVVSADIKGGKYISIGDNFGAIRNIRLECWDAFLDDKFSPNLTIGNFVTMNNNIHIGCINKIVIGNNVLFASNIFVTDHYHGFVDKRDLNLAPHLRPLYSKGPVIIEDDVWIGENVTIMPNVTIGKGCIIGANTVVTKSFEEYSIIAGVPAKLIRNLKD
jgi:acetyltransferase-like isoleucine patch superfamily enzyme